MNGGINDRRILLDVIFMIVIDGGTTMRINENFTAEMIMSLRKENMRLKRLDELELNEEEKDIINDICSALFKWGSGQDIKLYSLYGIPSVKYQIHHSGVDKDKICKWFRIQGFKPNAFNLKENEICISVM